MDDFSELDENSFLSLSIDHLVRWMTFQNFMTIDFVPLHPDDGGMDSRMGEWMTLQSWMKKAFYPFSQDILARWMTFLNITIAFFPFPQHPDHGGRIGGCWMNG